MKSQKYVEKNLKKHFKKTERSISLPSYTKTTEDGQTVRLYKSRKRPLVSAAAFAVYIVGFASMIGLFLFVGRANSPVDPENPSGNNAAAAQPESTAILQTDPANTTDTPDMPETQAPTEPSDTDASQTPESTQPGDPTVVPAVDEFESLFHSYKEVGDLDAYKESHANLMKEYFGSFEADYSVVNEGHWHGAQLGKIEEGEDGEVDDDVVGEDGEVDDDVVGEDGYLSYFSEPSLLFDGNTMTIWDDATEYIEGCSAIVWSMTEAVEVSGYSITTANTNSIYTERNPVKWRLYGANELPSEGMDSHFKTQTVPEGWTLIDAVDASEDGNTLRSMIPDLDCYEAAMEVQNPGSYKYFMLLIDYCEQNMFAASEITLYGSAD